MGFVRTRGPIAGLSIKTALLLSFGLTFGVWLFAGYHFTRRIGEVEQRAAAINSRYTRGQELLGTVRAQVLLGSVYVRDALLDPDPTTTADYRRRLEETYQAVDQALDEYQPVVAAPADREHIMQLRRVTAEFRATMLEVLAGDSGRWPPNARILLRTKIVPKREVVIRVSEEVQALNRRAFVQQQKAIADIYGLTQRQLWQRLGVALAASFGIALLATIYATRLERGIRQQRLQDARNADQLQRLSAKLITAQEEERRSIARELHDEVGQVLTTIKVELAVAQRTIEASGGGGHVLNDARTITDGALATVRDLSHLLHPSLLDDLGLAPAVEWYLRGFGKRHQLRAEVLQDRMDERLAADVEASAFRIVQEALTNIAKHARATTCRVYLQRLQHTVLITIEDDGVGFDVKEIDRTGARGGLGLVGMRERAAQLRGTIRVESVPGKGTRITAELPARVRTADEAQVIEIGGAADTPAAALAGHG
jgi:signal transduction histidine kinase